MASYTISESNISIVVNGRPYIVLKRSPVYQQLLDAIKAGKSDAEIQQVCSLEGAVKQYSDGVIEIVGNTATYLGRPLPEALTRRLVWCLEEKVPFTNLRNFIMRLDVNPSKRSVETLYKFLEFANLPITPEGHILAKM